MNNLRNFTNSVFAHIISVCTSKRLVSNHCFSVTGPSFSEFSCASLILMWYFIFAISSWTALSVFVTESFLCFFQLILAGCVCPGIESCLPDLIPHSVSVGEAEATLLWKVKFSGKTYKSKLLRETFLVRFSNPPPPPPPPPTAYKLSSLKSIVSLKCVHSLMQITRKIGPTPSWVGL